MHVEIKRFVNLLGYRTITWPKRPYLRARSNKLNSNSNKILSWELTWFLWTRLGMLTLCEISLYTVHFWLSMLRNQSNRFIRTWKWIMTTSANLWMTSYLSTKSILLKIYLNGMLRIYFDPVKKTGFKKKIICPSLSIQSYKHVLHLSQQKM